MSVVYLQVGDVVRTNGAEYIVDFVNESRARCVPLTRKDHEINTRFGDHATFQTPGNPINISTSVPTTLLLTRGGKAALQQFLSAAASRRKKPTNEANTVNSTTETEGQETMAKVKAVKLPARGGLAASAAAAKNGAKPAKAKNPAGEAAKGKLGAIMGHSTCAVIRMLAHKGASKARIIGILGKLGVTASPATIQIQSGKGKNEKDGRAPLSGEQVEELFGKFAEPVVEAKESKKDKEKEATAV